MSWRVRVPALERSVRMNQCVIANALQRSGGESELFNLWISEAKASPGWAPLTKIFFWLNNLFPPGFEPQTFLCEHTHSKHWATEDFTILTLKMWIYIQSRFSRDKALRMRGLEAVFRAIWPGEDFFTSKNKSRSRSRDLSSGWLR